MALGAPFTLALRTVSPGVRRGFLLPILHSRVAHALTRLWVVGVLYAAAMFLTHFTGFYNLALGNDYIHDIEHLIYLVLSFLLWMLLVGVDPVLRRSSHGPRMLMLILLMPVPAFIGVIFITAPTVLYPYYAALPPPWGGINALQDQPLAGVIMWVPSQFATVIAGLLLAVEWFRVDDARQRRIEALQDRREQRSPRESAFETAPNPIQS
ncbi:MAG: cytochrome c oxidase assembly protein [Pseudonocardiaceae bacterium]